MTTEEKAKAYDEAIERAEGLIDFCSDSELKTLEYVFPELGMSEDEKVRKAILELVKQSSEVLDKQNQNNMIAWLEKQGEHANFRNKIQVGDRVTRNEDGVLVNLSQLKRVAKPSEKQAEQKPNLCDGCINRKGCINCENGELREAEQKPAEWSEEDEKTLTEIFSVAARASLRKSTLFGKNYDYIKWQNWLKSLRPQNHWKPSDEQIEALARVQYLIEGDDEAILNRDDLETVFPELKENNKDEKIRKELLFLVKMSVQQGGYALHVNEANDMIAWLEKQGKRPLWNIQDARPGDVLITDKSGWMCIFKNYDGYNFSSYCFMDGDGYFFEEGSEAHTLDERIGGKIHLATKEQRDVFFQKMHKSGYQWDEKKLELKQVTEN